MTVDDGRVVVVGASMEDREALDRLAILLAVVGPLALRSSPRGWFVGRCAPPDRIDAREAAAIGASEPGRRLPVPDTGDEVARLAETLNGMLGRLEAAIERERRFAADASHELRTPWRTSGWSSSSRSAGRGRRRSGSGGAERGGGDRTPARLADDLLVLARSDRGRPPIRREPVDVAVMVGGTVDSFAARASERGVGIDVHVPGELRADVDELRMRQALGNLLDNGLRYVPAGGRLTVAAERGDGSLRLEVRDNGPGFPPEFLPIAFEAFARPDESRSRPEGGPGLGLAIVAAVAQAHRRRTHPG